MDVLNLAADALAFLNPLSQSGLADYALFRLISGWIESRVDSFGMALMGRSMSFVGGVGLSFSIFWLMLQGYHILAGAREPMMGKIWQGTKMALIFGVASSMAVYNIPLNSFLTKDMDKAIHQLVTGDENESTASSIDKSLAIVQIALSAIDGVQLLTPDPELLEEKRTAKSWATVGSAAPAIAAGCMLLLWTFGINLWIGLGPIFIFALAFSGTKAMFYNWLKFGLATLFSMAMLSFVANLLLDITVRIATFMWLAKLANLPGVGSEGISAQAMQQGSIGMIFTVLIVAVPPMAAYFFQAQIGNVISSSAFARYSQSGGGQYSGAGAPTAPTPPLTPSREEASHKAPIRTSMTDSTSGHSNEIKKKE
jgi:type IV secretion system protein VirB6